MGPNATPIVHDLLDYTLQSEINTASLHLHYTFTITGHETAWYVAIYLVDLYITTAT